MIFQGYVQESALENSEQILNTYSMNTTHRLIFMIVF